MDPTTQDSLRDGFLTDCKRIHREWDTRAKSLDTDGLISLYAQDALLETPLGSVWIRDSHPGLVVIQAWDGPIRFD